jgi:hypothetical protein
MSRRRSFSSQLYHLARTTNNLETLFSGNPNRIARRAKNVILGRALGRAGLWRALWR